MKSARLILYYPGKSNNGKFDFIIDNKGYARCYTSMDLLEKYIKDKEYDCVMIYTLNEIVSVK